MQLESIFYFVGRNARAFRDGYDLAGVLLAQAEVAVLNKHRVKKLIGNPRLRQPVIPALLLQAWTCKQLDAELRRLDIRGRSKARRKADKIALIMRHRLA